MLLKTTGLSKSYNGRQFALREIDLRFEGGAFVAVLGANGAGKSTLLRCLAGLTTPTQGEVTYSNISTSNIGWSSQHTELHWLLTVRENVVLAARMSGMNIAEANSRAATALIAVGLQGMANHLPDVLSGGQQQRVQIARVLVQNPAIMFLDEPTTGVDVVVAERIMHMLCNLAADGRLIFLSSHDPELIESFCTEVVFLENGRLIYCGPMEGFLQSSRVQVQIYFRPPQDPLHFTYQGHTVLAQPGCNSLQMELPHIDMLPSLIEAARNQLEIVKVESQPASTLRDHVRNRVMGGTPHVY